jgi:UDPglucose 6-dehydrogenase
MRIAVVGTGHVGLVVSSGLAELGHDVVCIGDDESTNSALLEGDVGLYEPGLPELLRSNVEAKRLTFGIDLEAAVRAAEVVIICIDVGIDSEGDAALGPLFVLGDRIGKAIDGYKVIALKSTVPVGTADRLAVRIGAHGSVPFGVASNPAFLKEGEAVGDFMKPDRVVIGSSDERAAALLRSLYAPLVRTPDRVIEVGTRSAELAKHAASALLATRISFMNEVAHVAEELGADIEAVRQILGQDPRIGPEALFVGPGFGGLRFQRDLEMLVASAREAGGELTVLNAVREVNQRQKRVLISKLERALGGLNDRVIGVWGLAFKPRTDDIGGSPALELINGLLDRGAAVRAHDPQAMANARAVFGQRVTFAEDMYEAAEGVQALVAVTDWHQYRRPDLSRLSEAMEGRVLLDGRNIWDPVELRRFGFRHLAIGRP